MKQKMAVTRLWTWSKTTQLLLMAVSLIPLLDACKFAGFARSFARSVGHFFTRFFHQEKLGRCWPILHGPGS